MFLVRVRHFIERWEHAVALTASEVKRAPFPALELVPHWPQQAQSSSPHPDGGQGAEGWWSDEDDTVPSYVPVRRCHCRSRAPYYSVTPSSS